MTFDLDLTPTQGTMTAWRGDQRTIVATLPTGFVFGGKTWRSQFRADPNGDLIAEQTVTVDSSVGVRTLTIELDFTDLEGTYRWEVEMTYGGKRTTWWSVVFTVSADVVHA